MPPPPQQLPRWQLDVGEKVKAAHDQLGTASVRRVARDLDLSHVTLLRVRKGELASVGRDTLLRILGYYGLKPPAELDLDAGGGMQVEVRRVSAYCSSPECPTARVMLVDGAWVARPLTLSVQEAMFAGDGEPCCRECGSRLWRRCRNDDCSRAYTKGAFCSWCSAPFVHLEDLDDRELRALRDRSFELARFCDRVEEY